MAALLPACRTAPAGNAPAVRSTENLSGFAVGCAFRRCTSTKQGTKPTTADQQSPGQPGHPQTQKIPTQQPYLQVRRSTRITRRLYGGAARCTQPATWQLFLLPSYSCPHAWIRAIAALPACRPTEEHKHKKVVCSISHTPDQTLGWMPAAALSPTPIPHHGDAAATTTLGARAATW